jgi:MFS transporter, DHA2 family, multidrug resistance protein
MLTPMIVRRVRPAFVMAAGLALGAPGFAVFTQVDAASGLAIFVAGTVAFSLGLAPVFTLTTDLIVGSAPPERAGAAAAISETSGEFGGALGIAVFGSIGIAVYRSMMADAMPAGVPPDVAEAARATLGGAVAMAGQLPGQLGPALVDAARAAFIQGLRAVAAISVVGSLALAVFTLVALRNAGPGAGAESQAASEAEGEAGSRFRPERPAGTTEVAPGV